MSIFSHYNLARCLGETVRISLIENVPAADTQRRVHSVKHLAQNGI